MKIDRFHIADGIAKAMAMSCCVSAEKYESVFREINKSEENNMENEWKELDIANLPPDILVKDAYEFYWKSNGSTNTFVFDSWVTIRDVLHQVYDVRYEDILFYRKPAPKAPTHWEICSLWWEYKHGAWGKVGHYNQKYEKYMISALESHSDPIVSKDWFVDKRSSDIPPEAN